MRTLAEGVRILCGRDFWRAYWDYWRPEAVAKRMEAWVERQKSYYRHK